MAEHVHIMQLRQAWQKAMGEALSAVSPGCAEWESEGLPLIGFLFAFTGLITENW